jgi:proteasome assembly chaperone (PAC2) family protein
MEAEKGTKPERWLVAAWPGLGHVATTAAVYMLSKMRMDQISEFTARGLFETESVDVSGGLLRASRLPRSRLFLWRNPTGGREILVFLGEAQPTIGKLELCQRLMAQSVALGVSRVFTFSAMATDMEPSARSRTIGVASDQIILSELRRGEVPVLSEGTIGGLNGVALAAAAEAGIPAVGLLGEIPALAADSPYPSAAAAVLRVFMEMAELDLDLGELEDYGRTTQLRLVRLYDQIREIVREKEPAPEGPVALEGELGDSDFVLIEKLFLQGTEDRAKAFELKRELDRLGVFRRYEDRFLDLFEPRA